MSRRVAAGLAVALALAGCASDKKTAKAPGDKDDYAKAFAELEKNDKDKEDASKTTVVDDVEREQAKGPVYPAPFTAEQIKGATRNGRTYRYKVEAPNEQARERVITFKNVDEGGAEIQTSGENSRRMSWATLVKHAEFPRDKVQTHPEKLKTPAGKFDCVVYEVSGDDGEITTYYFAKKLPGAPVYFYVERRGKRLRTTTLVEHVAGR